MATADLAARPRGDWLKRYPPLVAIVLVTFLAIYALPSALNLPQANPGQVAEYAPVPGQSNTAPPNGNLAALGLGDGGAASGGAPPPPSTAGSEVPSLYDCVGSPPRQDLDPMSPPCVPFFHGDNGGATWSGVTRNEITVVFRWEGPFVYSGDSMPDNRRPPTGYYDMEKPSDVSQWFMYQYLHDWEIYFNRHYQTYHRRVHFWAYQYTKNDGDTSAYSPTDARAEAADNWATKHPFAAVDEVGTNSSSYTTYLAQHGVVDFGGLGFTQKLASQYPGLYWSFPPTLDRQAQEYASYVCNRVVKPGKVSFSGNNDHGKPRVYGLLLSSDPEDELTQERGQLALKYMKDFCSISIKDTEYIPYTGCDCSGTKSGWGTTNMARFQTAGVTTILWPGGFEVEDSQAASNARWYPEWVLMGDDLLDGTQGVTGFGGGTAQPNDEMSHAWVTTRQPIINAHGFAAEEPCYEAIVATDPGVSRSTAFADVPYACELYDDIRQLFTGIQLAGPKLTPTSMDEGFHAIPARNSTNPYQVSCYYLPGDYTCVKDGAAMWWDPNAPTGTGSNGCWRMWENGARFLVGNWPVADVLVGKDPNDIWNLYDGGEALGIGRTH